MTLGKTAQEIADELDAKNFDLTYEKAKPEIEQLTGMSMPIHLQAFICQAHGDEFRIHGRLGWAIRRPGSTRWESRPLFNRFDEAFRYLIDDHTNVTRMVCNHARQWHVELARVTPERIDGGAGRGSNPGHALAAAWMALQAGRNKPPAVEPVVRCPDCGITVFASSNNTTGHCTGCEQKAQRA